MKTKLLKQYRSEALRNLEFDGGWSGYWTTEVDGVRYRSNSVSGFCYLVNDTGVFIQNVLIHRINLLRQKKFCPSVNRVFIDSKIR